MTPAVMWLAYFAVLAVAFNVGWSVELWSGVAVMSALTGVGLSVLVVPPPVPVPLSDGVAVPDDHRRRHRSAAFENRLQLG